MIITKECFTLNVTIMMMHSCFMLFSLTVKLLHAVKELNLEVLTSVDTIEFSQFRSFASPLF